jgi:hypothetical protein
MPGEKVLILTDNSVAAVEADKKASHTGGTQSVPQDTTSNLEQWLNFLFGGYSKSINDGDKPS